jgi:uncharacterized SAM-binding protein YcdF (DUF218 family)
LNNLLWSLFKPSQLILLTAFLAIVLWHWRPGRWFAGATAGLVLLLGLAPVGQLLIRPLENRFELPRSVTDVDGVVVLAGAERVRLSELHAQPQISAAGDRLTTFLSLAHAHPAARLVHSGAFEAAVARELILGAGVAPSRVRFEDQARNTCDSGPATRELVDPQPGEHWLLVTSAFHMPRAVACFRAAGWDIVPYPTDFRTGSTVWSWQVLSNLENLDLAAHEWLGLAYYRLRGRTAELFPAPIGAPRP